MKQKTRENWGEKKMQKCLMYLSKYVILNSNRMRPNANDLTGIGS